MRDESDLPGRQSLRKEGYLALQMKAGSQPPEPRALNYEESLGWPGAQTRSMTISGNKKVEKFQKNSSA